MKANGFGPQATARSPRRGPPAIAVALGLLLASAPAFAQGGDEVETGHRLARRWCVTCHAVEPPPATGRAGGAPSFAAIARMPSTTAMSLHAFLQTPHPRMPNYILSPGEIDAVSSYILSMKPERR